MRVIFLGPPGAGKGTQAGQVAAHFKIAHIATGDMLRRAIEDGTDLGLLIKERLDNGELVSDELTNHLVEEAISAKGSEKGFILDGYPRNVQQALALDDSLERVGARLDRVVRFMLMGSEIVERISGRRVCPACKAVYHVTNHIPRVEWLCDNDQTELVQREDDRPEAVLRRLEVYGEKTKPLFEFYEQRGLIAAIDAIGSEEEVRARILSVL